MPNGGCFISGHIPWNKGLGGIHLSPETEFRPGNISPLRGCKGIHLSPETEFKNGYVMTQAVRDKISLTMKGNAAISGRNSHMYGKRGKESHHWGGGKTPLNRIMIHWVEYKEWREKVFSRDNYTCQQKDCEFCSNKRGVELHPHHISSLSKFPGLAFELSNGKTYCKEFHLKSGLHSKGGE